MQFPLMCCFTSTSCHESGGIRISSVSTFWDRVVRNVIQISRIVFFKVSKSSWIRDPLYFDIEFEKIQAKNRSDNITLNQEMLSILT